MRKSGKAEKPHQLIKENLTRVYQEKIDEGIPDRFQNLLERLRKADSEPDTSECDKQEDDDS